ncbi:MAG TPA: bacillithiol biosynthesis BshC, partial [Gemmatimonadales bacterium]|nr:bacillithiol biosynthesis BshC [Gemmatimonadales bacterium]
LAKFGLALEDLLVDGAAERRIVRDQLPADVTGPLARLRASLEQDYEALAAGAAAVDPTLEKSVQGARGQALKGLDDTERKIVANLKRRRETELAQVGRIRAAVRPDGKPQERVLTAASLLARLGPAMLDAVLAEVEAWYAVALEAPSAVS